MLSRATGCSDALRPILLKLNIFLHYESFMRSVPWKRHPATLYLKRTCGLLVVGFYIICVLRKPTRFQENGCPGFQESDVDVKLKAFWSAFIWKVVPDFNRAAQPRLNIRYYQVDMTLCIHNSFTC